jgi:hypothetical protein
VIPVEEDGGMAVYYTAIPDGEEIVLREAPSFVTHGKPKSFP